jgi:hypothetical protein
MRALDVVERMFGWLVVYGEAARGDGGAELPAAVHDLWVMVLQLTAKVCVEPNEHLRDHAVVVLHRYKSWTVLGCNKQRFWRLIASNSRSVWLLPKHQRN